MTQASPPPARPRFAVLVAAFVVSLVRGRGLAIAALAIAGVGIAVWAVTLVLGLTGQVERDASGRIVEAGDLELNEVRAGDCLDGVSADDIGATVRGVPCSQPHDAEVAGAFDLPAGAWPGEATVKQLTTAGCDEFRVGYSAAAASDPALQPVYLTPLEEDWPRDRRVVCLLVGSGKLTGSLRGK